MLSEEASCKEVAIQLPVRPLYPAICGRYTSSQLTSKIMTTSISSKAVWNYKKYVWTTENGNGFEKSHLHVLTYGRTDISDYRVASHWNIYVICIFLFKYILFIYHFLQHEPVFVLKFTSNKCDINLFICYKCFKGSIPLSWLAPSLSYLGLKLSLQEIRDTGMESWTSGGNPPPLQGGRERQPRGEERNQPNFKNTNSSGQEDQSARASHTWAGQIDLLGGMVVPGGRSAGLSSNCSINVA